MARKIWHQGELKTQEQVWADQSPYEAYRDACRRLESGSPELARRWLTLGDCNRAMAESYSLLSPEAKAYEDKLASADLVLIELGLC